MKAIRVTVEDLATGDQETQEVDLHDYLLLCTGDVFVASIQAYKNGTHVLTVKGRKKL